MNFNINDTCSECGSGINCNFSFCPSCGIPRGNVFVQKREPPKSLREQLDEVRKLRRVAELEKVVLSTKTTPEPDGES